MLDGEESLEQLRRRRRRRRWLVRRVVHLRLRWLLLPPSTAKREIGGRGGT